MSAKITVTINGRAFPIGCQDGEQRYLRELAHHVDNHVRNLAGQVGQIGDLRLLLMAALVITDEQKELKRQIAALEEDNQALRDQQNQGEAVEFEARAIAADVLLRAAKRLEELAPETGQEA
ncbi:cell division protein ZapA [Woodsholea maritima]|uniref:cell division protein ZapA n=1 Tax=Woodsholea maritima TaxID=240237 RepID=UPI00036A579E|nr:cell division protein ZapA [Woodsholea maritima]